MGAIKQMQIAAKADKVVKAARPTMIELESAVFQTCPTATLKSKSDMYRAAYALFVECCPTIQSGFVFEWICTCLICTERGRGVFYRLPIRYNSDGSATVVFRFQYGRGSCEYSRLHLCVTADQAHYL